MDQKVKRELAASSGRIRLLTAHGSKGLEAPVVYMPDAASDFYAKMSKESYVWDVNEDNQDKLFYGAYAKKLMPVASKKKQKKPKKARVFKDEMRLLYVALTRAKDRLYIAGEGKEGDHSWHGQILHAIDGTERWQQTEEGGYVYDVPVAVDVEDSKNSSLETVEEAVPAYILKNPEKPKLVQQLKGAKRN